MCGKLRPFTIIVPNIQIQKQANCPGRLAELTEMMPLKASTTFEYTIGEYNGWLQCSNTIAIFIDDPNQRLQSKIFENVAAQWRKNFEDCARLELLRTVC